MKGVVQCSISVHRPLFAPGVEQLVIDTVHKLLPKGFLAKSQ